MIPLNDAGETVEHLYGYDTPAGLEEAVERWLKVKVMELEAKAASAA